MTMAFSGMDKDERQASGIDFWEGGELGKSFLLAPSIGAIMLENLSVGVVDSARVKGVLGVSVRPRSQGRG